MISRAQPTHRSTPQSTLPIAPPGVCPEDFFSGIQWHQRWPIFADISTPGINPVLEKCGLIELPADLSGQRVLDIGPWNGCFSFECERRGAAEVIAYGLENPKQSGFSKLSELLGSKVEYVQGSVYSLSPKTLGEFDVVLFLGVLYHLRYPLLAVDRIRTVCTGEVFIETFTTGSRHLLAPPLRWLGRWTGLATLFRDTPLWRQFRTREIHPTDQSNWFGPNVAAVLETFESAGFDIQFLRSWVKGER
ncbi:MAG: class I SAM-dependent methyltransferase [Gemmataceae bacterium]